MKYLILFLLVFIPVSVLAAEDYIVEKSGIYIPTSGDLGGFESVPATEIALGHYFNDNFAIEAGIGHFSTGHYEFGVIPVFGDYAVYSKIRAFPITVSALGIHKEEDFELFGKAGIGLYYSEGEQNVLFPTFGGIHVGDSDISLGLHIGGGANFDLNDILFLGIEGKYFISEANYEAFGMSADVDLDGLIFTINIGHRF